MKMEDFCDEIAEAIEIVEKAEAKLEALISDAEDVDGIDWSREVADCWSVAESLANNLEGIALGLGL